MKKDQDPKPNDFWWVILTTFLAVVGGFGSYGIFGNQSLIIIGVLAGAALGLVCFYFNVKLRRNSNEEA